MIGKKKITAAVIGLLGVSIVVAAGVLVWNRNLDTEEALKENQSYVYAYVSKIQGNELTYMELDEAVAEAYIARTEEADKADADTQAAGDEGVPGELPEGNLPEGEMPEEGKPEGEMPEGEMPEGNLPEGGKPEGNPSGEMPEGEVPGEMPEGEIPEEGTPQGEMTEREAPGTESVTTLIPVGTTVHTNTDTETTFQRLAAGDMLKLLVEPDADGEEVIVEIWML